MKNTLLTLVIFISFNSYAQNLSLENLIEEISVKAKVEIYKPEYIEKGFYIVKPEKVEDYYVNDRKLKEIKEYLTKFYKNIDSFSVEKKETKTNYAYNMIRDSSLVKDYQGNLKYSAPHSTAWIKYFVGALNEKYKKKDLNDGEIDKIIDENNIRPISHKSTTTKPKFGFELLRKAMDTKKGVKYNREEVYSKFTKIFTKEKILNFLKKEGINNTVFFENKNLIEVHTLIAYNYKHTSSFGTEQYGDFAIVIENNKIKYTDDGSYIIRITKEDLKFIPNSLDEKISDNIINLGGFLISEYAKEAKVLSNKGWQSYETDGLKKARSGDYKGSLSDFDKAIQLSPDPSVELYASRGAAKKETGDHSGAVKDFTKALDLEPSHWNAVKVLTEMAFSKILLKDVYGALFDCEKAIKINNRSAEAYGVRGIAKGQMGDMKGACADVQKAKELGNSYYSKLIEPVCSKIN